MCGNDKNVLLPMLAKPFPTTPSPDQLFQINLVELPQGIPLFDADDIYCACFMLYIIADLHYTSGDPILKLKNILVHYSVSQVIFLGFILWVTKMKRCRLVLGYG